MTTLVPTLTATDDDIAEFVTEIRRLGPASRYAYTTGYLGGIIRALAIFHGTCDIENCSTCGQIRRGLAVLAALDRVEGDTTGGAR